MDFDDLIMVTVNLFQAFPDVAAAYRRRFRHVLVDEYQDTNHAQYVLIRELVSGGSSLFIQSANGRGGAIRSPTRLCRQSELCVVGDADQSIYAFRGATIRNIVEFEQDYPDATVILLEQNYRSTQNILAAANAVVSRNPGRKPKNLWSDAGAARRSPATSLTTSTTRPRSSPRRSTGSPTRAWRIPATWRSSTARTRSPVSSRKSSSGSACPTGWSAASGSTSARRSATCSPTCG